MNISALLLGFVLVVGCDHGSHAPPVAQLPLIVSDEGFYKLTPVADVPVYHTTSMLSPSEFLIDETVEFQEIDGFGASFLEAGIKTLNTLPTVQAQDEVLKKIFDPISGAGFSLMKTVIGGTDFQSAENTWYTYNDTPGDITLSTFSIARDLGTNGLVTYIQRARSNGGSFRLQAPMDYPPDWMLYDVNSDQNVNPIFYPVLAEYYVKYLQAYEAQGIHIDQLSPFNEPGVYTKISFPEIGTLIKNHIGPAFTAHGITTGIQISEPQSRSQAAEFFPPLLDDTAISSYVSVLPFHGYFFSDYTALANLISSYPTKKFWMTEVCCLFRNRPENSGHTSGNALARSIFKDIEAGVSGWIFWNMILDEVGGPWLISPIHENPDGNAQDSLVMIDKNSHHISFTPMFYHLAHFSKFVRPGARLVKTTPQRRERIRVLTFKGADGKLTVQILNGALVQEVVYLRWKNFSIRVPMPLLSVATLVFDPATLLALPTASENR